MRMVYFAVSVLFALAQSTTVPAPPAAGSASSQPALPASPAEVMTPKDAKERMDLARKVNGLQGLDIPWHLKASYEVFAADGKSSDTGTYEEWRVNAKQYRIALHGSSVSVDALEGIGPAGLSALTVPAGASPVTVPVDVTGEAIRGRLLNKVVPMYPATAKLQGVQGTVILNGVISKEGHFKKLQVLAGPPMLQQAAIDAVQQWAYTPYLLGGQPVEVETDVNVVFALGR